MQLICKHDPSDPHHLICETKMPWQHRALEIGLGILVLALLFVSVGLFVKRGGEKPQGYPVSQLQGSSFAPTDSVGAADAPNAAQQGSPAVSVSEEGEEESPLYSGQKAMPPHPSPLPQGEREIGEPYFEAEALYFTKEGEQVGRGPWPSKVGEITKLKVFWKMITPSLRDGAPSFSDVFVSGHLGPNVNWTGFAPQGQGLSYEPENRTVRWNIVCQVSGVRCENTAVFEVAIIPTALQIQENQILVVDNLTLHYNKRKILFPNLVISWE